jgi:hypothetical protein
LGPVERQPVLDQPFREIDTGNGADRNGALVLVAVNFNALDRTAGYEGI